MPAGSQRQTIDANQPAGHESQPEHGLCPAGAGDRPQRYGGQTYRSPSGPRRRNAVSREHARARHGNAGISENHDLVATRAGQVDDLADSRVEAFARFLL